MAEPGEVTRGTAGPDVIVGTRGPNVIRGRGGADKICALGGDDVVFGGPGDDRIKLGGGDDRAEGGTGADLIRGNSGRDHIRGNAGADVLDGGKRGDFVSGGRNGDTILGRSGRDTLEGNSGPDLIDGGSNIDRCRGGKGRDELRSCNEPFPVQPGILLVGSDIMPGRYVADAARGCYWARLAGLGGELDDIIANEFQFFAGPTIVDVDDDDVAFEFDGECGVFRPYEAPDRPKSRIDPGAWVVGSDIRPGTYRAQADDGCYWERRRSFSGELSAIIANDFVPDGGPVLVTISPSDQGFYADDDCGRWSRI